MKIGAFLVAIFLSSAMASAARADVSGPFTCGGKPYHPECDPPCPSLVQGDCSHRAEGETCGSDPRSKCEPVTPQCASQYTTDAGELPTESDAGTPMLSLLLCMADMWRGRWRVQRGQRRRASRPARRTARSSRRERRSAFDGRSTPAPTTGRMERTMERTIEMNCRLILRMALVLTTLLTSATLARIALADGAIFPVPGGCQCGGPSRPYCREVCPSIIEGDCSSGVEGTKCGVSDLGECWPGTPDCRPKDAGTSKTDAGRPILYCQMYENCAMDDEGGCRIGTENVSARQRIVGLPGALIVSGVLFLAFDHRRRTRHRGPS
jgi:hypothetical protein